MIPKNDANDDRNDFENERREIELALYGMPMPVRVLNQVTERLRHTLSIMVTTGEPSGPYFVIVDRDKWQEIHDDIYYTLDKLEREIRQ